jgi:hypothetical protein
MEDARVTRTDPYHSISPEDKQVYHDQGNCPDGKRILPISKRSGTGNRPKCLECPKVS